MKEDAMYSLFRHAFLELGSEVEGEDLGLFDQKPVAEYANTVVGDLFALNITHIETEAAIVLNVWMWCVHELYNVLRACERNDANSQDDMNAALDIAVALWIGADQPLGDNERGNLLYNLAENAGARFDQGSAETLINTAIVEKFKAIQLGIGQGTCSGAGGYIEFRNIVRQVFGLMTVPLVQILIYHIMEPPIRGKSDFIELYALALAPRVEVCNPVAYKKMLDMFVKGDFTESSRVEAIALIQSTYPCLGITCAEVGEYQSGLVAECADDTTKNTFLAGYPAASNVDQVSGAVDILQYAILVLNRDSNHSSYPHSMQTLTKILHKCQSCSRLAQALLQRITTCMDTMHAAILERSCRFVILLLVTTEKVQQRNSTNSRATLDQAIMRTK
jgi:hypothetical protein